MSRKRNIDNLPTFDELVITTLIEKYDVIAEWFEKL